MSAPSADAPDKAKKRDESPAGKKGRRRGPAPPKKEELTEEQKAYVRQKFIEEKCTRVRFIGKEGLREEKLYENVRLGHYSELQRLIARVRPKSTAMVVCQFEDGSIITSENFKTVSVYRVRDMDTARSLHIRYCPRVDARWDFYEHHAGKPPGWIDNLQIKLDLRDKAKNDALDKKRQEEEARKLMERLENGGTEEPDSEEAWENL
jgi:hypothetical protein